MSFWRHPRFWIPALALPLGVALGPPLIAPLLGPRPAGTLGLELTLRHQGSQPPGLWEARAAQPEAGRESGAWTDGVARAAVQSLLEGAAAQPAARGPRHQIALADCEVRAGDGVRAAFPGLEASGAGRLSEALVNVGFGVVAADAPGADWETHSCVWEWLP